MSGSWMWSVVAALVVMAAPPALGAEKTRVVVLGISASDPKLKQLADSISEQVLTELGRTRRVDAMGTSDMAAVLGLERQKAVLGCTDQSASCLAEISAALGAPYLVTGNLAKAGKATRIDLKLIRAADGKALVRDGRSFKDESEMFDLVSEMVKGMVAEMNLPAVKVEPVAAKPADAPKVEPKVTPAPVVEPKPEVAVEAGPSKPGPRVLPWVVTGVGAVALLGGGAVAVLNKVEGETRNSTGAFQNQSASAAVAEASRINGNITVGSVVAGAGALVTAAGLWWALSSQSEPAAVTVVPVGNGVVLGGAW